MTSFAQPIFWSIKTYQKGLHHQQRHLLGAAAVEAVRTAAEAAAAEAVQIDAAAADFLAERCFIHRDGLGTAANLLSGMLHIWPHFENKLPYTARALQAWQRTDPGGAGEAIAAETVLCLAEDMERNGEHEASLILLIMFDTYCRQQDIFQLLPEDVTILQGSAQHREGTSSPAQGDVTQTVVFQFGVARRGERAKTGVDQVRCVGVFAALLQVLDA